MASQSGQTRSKLLILFCPADSREQYFGLAELTQNGRQASQEELLNWCRSLTSIQFLNSALHYANVCVRFASVTALNPGIAAEIPHEVQALKLTTVREFRCRRLVLLLRCLHQLSRVSYVKKIDIPAIPDLYATATSTGRRFQPITVFNHCCSTSDSAGGGACDIVDRQIIVGFFTQRWMARDKSSGTSASGASRGMGVATPPASESPTHRLAHQHDWRWLWIWGLREHPMPRRIKSISTRYLVRIRCSRFCMYCSKPDWCGCSTPRL